MKHERGVVLQENRLLSLPQGARDEAKSGGKMAFFLLYFSLMRWILLLVSNELKTAFCSKWIAVLLYCSFPPQQTHTPAVLRIVPFHNQGVKGQDIITRSFLLASWKSHLLLEGTVKEMWHISSRDPSTVTWNCENKKELSIPSYLQSPLMAFIRWE